MCIDVWNPNTYSIFRKFCFDYIDKDNAGEPCDVTETEVIIMNDYFEENPVGERPLLEKLRCAAKTLEKDILLKWNHLCNGY